MSSSTANSAALRPEISRANWTKAGPVVTRLPEAEIAEVGLRAAGSIGDASTLGLFGFATGTWMVSTVLTRALPGTALVDAAPVLLIFAGLVQFIAGLLVFRRANALAGTAFCCFGAFNVTAAMVAMLQVSGMLPHNSPDFWMQGFLFESFGFIALALTLAAVRTNLALVLVLGTLCVGYVLSGIPFLEAAAGPGTVGRIGAWFLIASALLAYYTGAAMVVNSAWGRAVFPLGGEP